MLNSKIITLALIIVLGFSASTILAQEAAEGDSIDLNNFISLGCKTIPECIELLVRGVRDLAFYVGVLFIVWSGFLFVTAGGDKTKINTARKTLTTTILGLAIVVGAWILAVAFNEFLKNL